ncbi:unnamed protein product [Camellia sinensis]
MKYTAAFKCCGPDYPSFQYVYLDPLSFAFDQKEHLDERSFSFLEYPFHIDNRSRCMMEIIVVILK